LVEDDPAEWAVFLHQHFGAICHGTPLLIPLSTFYVKAGRNTPVHACPERTPSDA
jgi:hypothetical protein